ncbi:MAG: hypothetical protein PHF56_01500 [Desulfuromonadaceae bacterium]|nr:hypothetical protein [Desulfuromonadaceae bacterium]
MRQMTLRDIPDDIEMLARSEASRQGISLNKAFLTLLRKSTQQKDAQLSSADKKRSSRFSRFCGIWTDTEATEFDKALLEQRSIDDEA